MRDGENITDQKLSLEHTRRIRPGLILIHKSRFLIPVTCDFLLCGRTYLSGSRGINIYVVLF